MYRYLSPAIFGLGIHELDANILCNLSLFGSHDLNVVQNIFIIEAKISFNEATKRLDRLNDKKINSSEPLPARLVCFSRLAWCQTNIPIQRRF